MNMLLGLFRQSCKLNFSMLRSFQVSLLFLFVTGHTCLAQTDSVFTGFKKPRKEKVKKTNADWPRVLTYAADFQFFPGAKTGILYFAPSLGYNAFESFNAGFGGVFSHIYKDYGTYGKINNLVFGWHFYSSYVIERYFFVLFQYDRLLQPNILTRYPNVKTWVDYASAGIGYRQPFGNNKGAFNISIMYNLTPEILTVYASPLLFQINVTGVFSKSKKTEPKPAHVY